MKNINRILCIFLCIALLAAFPIAGGNARAYAASNIELHGERIQYTYESSYSNLEFKVGSQTTPPGLAIGDDVYVYLKSQYAYGTKYRYLLYI